VVGLFGFCGFMVMIGFYMSGKYVFITITPLQMMEMPGRGGMGGHDGMRTRGREKTETGCVWFPFFVFVVNIVEV
jgi:hypothetical protein